MVALGVAQAGVVLNEILYRPGTTIPENTKAEFVELLNTGTETVSLGGWQFTKGVAFTFPAGTTIAPGGYLVVAADVPTFQGQYPGVNNVVGGWTGQLSNSGERIELVDATGKVVDSVEYSDEGDWAKRAGTPTTGWAWTTTAATGGCSLELRNPALPHDRGQNWAPSAAATGTPGTANSQAAADLAPLIDRVRHSPAVPRPGEAITISCTLEDENPTATSATLFWRLATASPDAFQSAAMTTGPNNRFSAVLPAQVAKAVVEFYIESSDGVNRRTWPAPSVQGAQTSNALFQVSDLAETGTAPHYRLILTSQELSTYNGILASNRNVDTELNATLVASDPSAEGGFAIRYLCGMRMRGNSSRSYNPPPLRVNLPADNLWGDVGAMNLNTRYPWLQVTGLRLLATCGIVAEDAKGVRVSLNDVDRATGNSTMAGLHAHVEPIDSRFVRRHFPSDSGGNLYAKRSSNVINGYGRDKIRWGVVNESLVRYNSPNWWVQENWDKDTNSAANDWSDLTAFARTMHTAIGPTYKEQVGAKVNIEQWLRWFAILTLLNDYETNPSNGIDDDYSMYRGETDQRFVLIPHDLDTILGQGDTPGPSNGTLFPFVTDETFISGDDRIPQLNAFFNNLEIRRRYFEIIKELLNGPLSKSQFDTFLKNHIGSWAPQTTINSMVTWMDQRRTYALGLVDRNFAVRSSLTLQNGFPRTTSSSTTLAGDFDMSETATVRVNGVNAALNYTTGVWTTSASVVLVPGINRIVVQSFDAAGKLLETRTIDIWYDTGTTQALPATITADTTLTAAGGPYVVTGEVVVKPGATLTVEAGTNLWFNADAKLTVNGVLRMLGSELAHIRCCPLPTAANVPDPLSASLPAGPPKWAGVRFIDTMSDQNVIQWTDFLHAQDSKIMNQGSVGVMGSRAVLDHLTFAGTHLRMVYTVSSSVLIQNSVFPDMFGKTESALTLGLDNIAEQIKGSGTIPAGGFYIIRGNTFGGNKGHNDVIDVSSGRRPSPIVQILGNVFTGGGDEQLDLDGDVYIAGNFFSKAVKDPESSDAGYSSGISTSDFGTGTTTVVVRNVFYDMDHALNLKVGAAAFFENNTVVKIHADGPGGQGVPNVGSAINLYVAEPGGERGDGSFVRDNIFFDAPRVFGNADLPSGLRSKLELYNNMLTSALAQTSISTTRPQTITTLGSRNFVADPQFVNATVGDFTLAPGTAGTGAGTFGQDLGAAVPEGIFITGEPAATTSETSATLRVGGPGIFAYRYRVNGGAWSADRSIGLESFSRTVPSVREGTIVLNGLAPGSYTVEVLGRDFAGNWQTIPTVSKTWTVAPNLIRIVINELLADNRSAHSVGGLYPDFIELYNPGAADVDLSGKSISDDPAVPAKFVFPAGTTIPARGYLVVYADSAASPGIHAGFALDNHGEGVYLYDSAANGGTLLDSVVFGLQLPDLSVGRIGRDGTWTLTQPTPGTANVAQPLGDPSALRINEWLAASQVRFDGDFVELYNPTTLPVALGGLRLSDEPYSVPGKFVIRPLSFAPARGFAVFSTASGPATDASILPFQLSASFEMLALSSSDGRILHLVDFDSERNDISRGFSPDGSSTLTTMLVPTPGASNLASGPVYDRMLALLNGLRISEVMYQPAGNADLEFIELVNVGNTALDLTGVRFVEGVDFVFPAMTLTPGSRVLVVKSLAAMQAAYGPNLYIAGEFTGRLDNSGERITLALPAPYDAVILSFRYSNTWAASTAGGGRSLEFTNFTLPPSAWEDAGNWGASSENGGNPTVLATPVITSSLGVSTVVGDTFFYRIIADHNPAGFNATGLPPGLAFDPLSGVISGTPTASGTFSVAISASNKFGTDSEILTLAVAASGPITSFVWDAIASPQVATVPFSASVRAVDAKGRTVRDFQGPAAIAPGANPPITIGTGTGNWTFPLTSEYSGARTQAIYLANEIGGSGKITALSLYVTAPPGQALNNWTIRMKHTALSSYGFTPEWEGSNWTTVYQANESISATGWVTFTFATPFIYDGINNLLVDFSFNNSGSSTSGLCRYTATSGYRSLYNYQMNNMYGDPLLWTGTTSPGPTATTLIPNVRMVFGAPDVTVSPTSTGSFVDGVWTGKFTVASAMNSFRLSADDGSGHVGSSNVFDVLPLTSPVINSPLTVVGVAGQPFSYRITATNSPASYGATGLPGGFTLNAADGIISGTPASDGVVSVELSATNASGTGTAQLTIDVQPDTDRDGLPDAWESFYGLNPNQPGEQFTDTDGDGISNLAEFLAGTEPRDHTSRFVVSNLQRTGAGGQDISLTWNTVTGKRYRVLCTSDLKANSWVELTPLPITATGPSATFKHSRALNSNVSFYRVEIVP
ncbi:lamin tail domain-containing protein [Verrucomicrobiota bacterium sgz303538]